MRLVWSLLLAYLAGSIPVGYLAGRYWKGIDLRRHGSGNTGTTNSFRILGLAPGLVVLAGDVLKGVLAVWLGRQAGGAGWALATGLAAIAGHSWSIFLGFGGGRGVATTAGVVLALSPIAALIAALVWGVVVLVSRYVSLGSVTAAVALPVIMMLLGQPWLYIAFAAAAAVLIIWRHLPNIRRLLAGKENRIGGSGRNLDLPGRKGRSS